MPRAFASRPSDSAAIIVGQDNDRPPLQVRPKDALTGNVEIIAVDEAKKMVHRFYRNV